MITTIIFILILGLLVLVHELGHFITARKLGVKVEEFAIGFPPRLFTIKRNGINYSINLIPVGGYVKIKGEGGEEDDDPHSFVNAASWKKLIIISAGVIMNFILAFVFLSAIFFIGFPQEVDSNFPQEKLRDQNIIIMEVAKDSPANQAGVEVGDKIVAINDQNFDDYKNVYQKIDSLKGQKVYLTVLKDNNEEVTYTLEHQKIADDQEELIGIGILQTAIVDYGFLGSIWQGLIVTLSMIGLIIKALYNLIADLLTQGKLAADFGGPVAVAVITGQIVKLGFINIVYFAAILSINLGVINFFPFPALDGGRAIFIAAQAITRKKLNQKVEAWIHNSGFIFLMGLIVLITVRDLQKYGAGIWSAIKAWF